MKEMRTHARFTAFLQALETLNEAPEPEARHVEALLTTIADALRSNPLSRSDAIRHAIDSTLPHILARARPEHSPILSLPTRYRDLCDRHDAIVDAHTCPSCRTPSYEICVVRRPLKQSECRLCADCRDRAIAQGKRQLCNMPIKGSCCECAALMVEIYCVGPCVEPLTERACGKCTKELVRQGWRPIVVSMLT